MCLVGFPPCSIATRHLRAGSYGGGAARAAAALAESLSCVAQHTLAPPAPLPLVPALLRHVAALFDDGDEATRRAVWDGEAPLVPLLSVLGYRWSCSAGGR
jgi:hypothetical protein